MIEIETAIHSAVAQSDARRVAIETVFERLAASLDLRWPEPAIGAAETIGATTHHGWRVPTVGYLNFIHPPQVQIVGQPEIAYLADLSPDLTAHVQTQIVTGRTRLVILADDCRLPEALHAALRQAGIAVFTTPASGHRVAYRLRHFLGETLARQITLHGVFLEVLSIGLLLVGEPGVGKSELALELINRGHRLVADDAPEFVLLGPDDLNGGSPPLLQDFLEVRGLGILNIRAMFGEAAIKRRKQLGLIIRLDRPEAGTAVEPDRLTGARATREILETRIPEICLPVAVGHNLSVLVEAAARDHLLRMQGQHSDEQFAQRQAQAIGRNSCD
ncbi:HPr(Ser) kinase/phosphatase [Salinisphaera sp. Q1T1-3]|uniref:HPr(Ser) kinase/phosphatase n=1 Tax=Salinisphaera sp. Q1T1-3 TaxID=2321229 RepID=UPI000E7246C8|nr:HPr(Ser) kinase/phosphatase [Salinisphaera sp. Q1T1-3]RJS92250.1 HPr(Ser) kinase/phosphatase [Salinisphaera sp. Q1T1-3]